MMMIHSAALAAAVAVTTLMMTSEGHMYTPAPADATTTTEPTAGPMCSNGVPGIESSNGACCVAACGQCGGIGCSTVAADKGLGSAECCEGTILLANEPCGEAPCIVGDGMAPAPTPTETGMPVGMPVALPGDDVSFSFSFSFSFDMEDDDLFPTEATPAPVMDPGMPLVPDGICSNGVKGTESSGGACCVLECGQCGGAGCSMVGASLGLGAADCCESVVLENNEPCGEAPCVIGDGTVPTPSPTETGMLVEMPVMAPTMTEMPVDMPVEMPVMAPTMTEMPVDTPLMAPTESGDSSSDDFPSDDGIGSTTTTSETSYLPSSDTDTYTDGTGVDSEDVPEDIPGTFEHLGCFKDKKGDRVLTRSKLGSPEMTADVCFEYCSMRGAAYMALQFGYECWCSRNGMLEYERHGDGAVCDYMCLGDENETCGGYDSFDLFKLWWPTEPEDLEYVGCYHDDTKDRVLAHKVTIPGMTTAVCRDYCSDKDALFYATQYSTECWCGTSDIKADYERHGPGNCYMGCDGEESVACGGYDSFSLFRYGDGETPPTAPTTEPPTVTEEPSSTDKPTMTGMPTMTEEPASMCSNGIPGIESSKGACCVAACGQCGGIGCSTVAVDKGLGSAECCEGTILLANEPCGEPPCIVGDKTVEVEPPVEIEAPASPTPMTTAPPASETPAPLVATPSEECEGDRVPVYEQCGGDTWKGSTCCGDGLECVVMGKSTCYSQCRPMNDTGSATPAPSETAEPVMPVGPPTAEPNAEPTPEPTAEPTPEATVEPTPEATVEPTPEATPEPTPEPTAEPTPEATAEPTPEPVMPVAPGPTGDNCQIVIIEAEDLPVTGDWKVVDDSAASGGKYIVWEGLSEAQNNQSPDDGDIISATIDITTPGTYSFKWLMRQPSGVETDKGNDSWLYFPDATRFGPTDSTASYGTFVKVYGRAFKGDFEYSGTAEDAAHVHTQIAVEFAQAGQYTMEIAGRSHGNQIDQIILFGEDLSVNDAAAGCP